MSDNPDKITECLPDCICPACGETIDLETKTLLKVKQEIDIPPIEPFIEQFEQYHVRCKCGGIFAADSFLIDLKLKSNMELEQDP